MEKLNPQLNFKTIQGDKKLFLLYQKTMHKQLELFAHSVYLFYSVNTFINEQNSEKTNFWALEDNFNLLQPILILFEIKSEIEIQKIQDVAFQIASSELKLLYGRSLNKYKKRTSIILEHCLRYNILNDFKVLS